MKGTGSSGPQGSDDPKTRGTTSGTRLDCPPGSREPKMADGDERPANRTSRATAGERYAGRGTKSIKADAKDTVARGGGGDAPT